MTTTTASTVISTSFTNEPQAIDDVYCLPSDSYGNGFFYFDVMSNDLVGNAKSLFSIDDGTSPGGGQTDLLKRKTIRAPNCQSGDHSAHGAAIWITSDGKIGYDRSTLSDDFKAQPPPPTCRSAPNVYLYLLNSARRRDAELGHGHGRLHECQRARHDQRCRQPGHYGRRRCG